MKRLVTAAALLLYACGGGGGEGNPSPATSPPPSTPLPTATYSDFNPIYEGSGDATAVLQSTRQIYSSYTWRPGRISWGGNVENQRVATCEGETWAWLDGYSHAGLPGANVGSQWPTFPVDTVRAEWINVQTGAVRDITALCGQQTAGGQPYIVGNLPQTGRYRIRVWGWVWNGAPPTGVRERPYYWEAEYTFGTSEPNVCWQGDAPSTRPVIVQQEAWWTQADGWLRGSAVNEPWQGGEPVEPGPATYRASNAIAAGAGMLWRYTDGGAQVCLQLATRH